MRFLLTCGILLVGMFFSGEAALGQDVSPADDVEYVSGDTTVNGYKISNPDILPFSPVIAPAFNLPDSSIVNIFLTDTLGQDTMWICEKKSLQAGLYRISPNAFLRYGDITEDRMAKLHFEARSKPTMMGAILDNLFQATMILGFR